MTSIRESTKLTNIGKSFDKIKKERDTYRDLCADLLDEVKEFYSRASGRSEGVEMLITKAESILGDKNGTAN